MENIIIIFFIIYILYNYLYEYYDNCKIKNCNNGYYLNNNICVKCDGIVSPDGNKCCINMSSNGYSTYNNDCSPASCNNGQQPSNKCVCSYPNDENILKNAAINYYNNDIYKNQYVMYPQNIKKVNETTFDMSYVYTNYDGSQIGNDKRRFTFNYNNSNCDIIITNMGDYNSGTTVMNASLENYDSYKLIKNNQSEKCLDGDGTNISFNNCDINNSNQKWANNYNLLKHKQSGKCLDSDGKKFYYSDCDTQNSYQTFTNETGVYGKLIKQKSSNKCLDSNGTSLYFEDCIGNINQSWSNDDLIKNIKTNKCLDSNGTYIYLSNCDNNNIYQKWNNDNNVLKHNQSKKCLGIDSNDQYFELMLKDCNITEPSQIYTKEKGTYGYLLKQKSSNKCLDDNFYLRNCDSNNLYQNWTNKFNNINLLKHMQSEKCLDSDGTNLYLNKCDSNNKYQNWYYDGKSYLHKQTGKCLDSSGNNLNINICNTDNLNQSFINGLGSYNNIIKQVSSGKCLDSDGTNINLNYCIADNKYQNWYYQ